jgi:hypothetical protein
VIEELAASDLVDLLASGIPGGDSELLSGERNVGQLLVSPPELDGDLGGPGQGNVFEVPCCESGVALDRPRHHRPGFLVLSHQLEGLEVIRLERVQNSAPDSDSVNAQPVGVAVEIFSERRGGVVGFISEVIPQLSAEDSFVVGVLALSLAVVLIGGVDLVQ